MVVLGVDAILEALPATPVQLAHACTQAGFRTVVPVSWGDELIATQALRELRLREQEPAVFCACPHVVTRLLGAGGDLAPFLMNLAPPPVATARYLREIAGDAPIRITFVGACPSGADESIDARFSPAEFLQTLAERGIVLSDQPTFFDSVLPPDRRRYRSLPGGLPTPESLWSEAGNRALIEVEEEGLPGRLAQHLMSRECALIDCAVALGCSCSGVVPSLPRRSARAAAAAHDPPRSASPILDESTRVVLSTPLPGRQPSPHPDAPQSTPAVSATPTAPKIPRARETAPVLTANVVPSRSPRRGKAVARSIARPAPAVSSSSPGRSLPRIHVARRRPSTQPGAPHHEQAPAGASPRARPTPTEQVRPGAEQEWGKWRESSRKAMHRIANDPRQLILVVVGAVLAGIVLGIVASASLRPLSTTAKNAPDSVSASTTSVEAGEVSRTTREVPVESLPPAPRNRTRDRGSSSASATATGSETAVVPPRESAPVRFSAPIRRRPAAIVARDAVSSDTVAPEAAARDTVAPSPASTIAAGIAARDSSAIAAERRAIRRELELRRNRLDSLAHFIDTLGPASPP